VSVCVKVGEISPDSVNVASLHKRSSILEFHYTSKHASWLNMVEIEIGNMNQQCLDRRIPSWDKLQSELAAWEKRKNDEGATIKWMFDVDKARKKLTRAYEQLNQSYLMSRGTSKLELKLV
jgi:hypothetical protein